MKRKSKLRILSWITTIAMMLSIFNVPILGYATESAVNFGLYAEVLDEEYEINNTVVTAESGHSVSGKCFNENDGVPYQVFRITGIDSSAVESVIVTSGGTRVAKVSDGDGYDDTIDNASDSTTVTVSDSPCFCVYFIGNGSTVITVSVDGEEMTFPIYVDLDTCEICGKYTCECDKAEYTCKQCENAIEECQCERCEECNELIGDCICGASDDEEVFDEYCVFCDKLLQECICLKSLNITYTLAGDGGEYTDTIYFVEGSNRAEITLKPYDPDSDIIITGTDGYGEAISENVTFDEGSTSAEVKVVSASQSGDDEQTYYVDVYKSTGPVAEITYYIDDEEVTKARYFDTENTYQYINIPYYYDTAQDISVVITHLDGTTETPDINWSGEYGWISFESVVSGNENSYELELFIETASSNTGCNIYVDAYDEDGNNFGYDIDNDDISSDGVTEIVVPYGYTHRVYLYANPVDDEFAKLDGFGDEEDPYCTTVSVGDTKTFKVIAQNGDESTYTLKIVASEGTSADIEMHANISYSKYDFEMGEYFSSDKEISIDFTDDNSAEVVLPYSYEDDNGIQLIIDSNDNYNVSYGENNKFYLGDDDEETVEFTVTSPDGVTETKSYAIKFTRGSEEESKRIDFETFTFEYVNENNEKQVIDISATDASDENGATIIVPGSAITEDEYYVDLYAKLTGDSYIYDSETNADSYNGGYDSKYIEYSLDLSSQRTVRVTFSAIAPNGKDMTTYTVILANGNRANEADVDSVKITYTRINEDDDTTHYITLDEENNTGEYTLYPYDDTMPIVISGEAANGSKIYKLVTFEEGEDEATFTFTSNSPNGEYEKTYTVTVMKPTHPLVYVNYQDAAYNYDSECDFGSDYKDTVYIPYDYDQEYGIKFDITLIDGSKLEQSPEIIWESETREDEHDPLIGKAQFEYNGNTYTINIEVEGISANKNVYMYMHAWDGVSYDEWGEKDYNYISIDYEQAASEEGATVAIPFGCENDSVFYINAEDDYATLEGYDEEGNEYSEVITPGETRIYTVTAQDGTTQDYKITFVESGGNSTAIEADMYFTNTSMNEYEYNCYKYLYFEENDEGIMEMNFILPRNFSEENGIVLYDFSSEQVKYSIPLEEKILIDPEEDPTFEFTVTSPNGQVITDYVINFSKETAEEAANTDLEYMEVYYTDEDGKEIYSEVDLSQSKDGSIDVDIPKNIDDKDSVSVSVYLNGYTWNSDGPTMLTEHEMMGKGDPDWFNAGFMRTDSKPISFEFDVTSSDGTNTKTYTVTIKDHDCSFDESDITVPPTCTEEGEMILTCTDDECGATKKEIAPALDHDYDTVVTAPTCTEEGYTTYTCKNDPEHTYIADYVDAAGHKMTFHKEVAATCLDEGNIAYYTCDVCEGYFLDEDGKEATSAEKIVAKAIGHEYEAVVTAPTCTEKGYTTYTCKNDPEHTYIADYVDAAGHKMTFHKEVAATCLDEGNIAYYTCDVCEGYFLDEDGKEATSAEKVVIEATGHNYKSVVTAPTCTEYGYTTYTCSACDDRYVEDGDDPLGHDYEAVETKPTCTEGGYITYTCKRDASHTYTTDLDPDGHEMKEHAAVEATCEEAGNIAYYTCNVCEGYFLDEKGEEATTADKVVVEATGHKYGAYKTTTKAEFGKAGVQTATCTACSDKVTKPIAAPKTIKLSYTSYKYNGKIKKPTITLYDSAGNKISSANYKVTYASGRKNVGKYKVTVTIKNDRANYAKSSKYTTFKINPKGTSISKLSKGKKSFTVKWKKQSSKMAKTRITGYQYRYSTSSKMTNAVIKTVKGYSKTSAKKTGLKAKKTYYVQVRTYKTVKGVKYYSDWSKTKSVKTR